MEETKFFNMESFRFPIGNYETALRHEREREKLLEYYSIEILKELIRVNYSSDAALIANKAVKFADELIRAIRNKDVKQNPEYNA